MPQAVFAKDAVVFLPSLICPIASCGADRAEPFSWLFAVAVVW